MSDELVEGEESFQVSFDAVDFKGSYDFIGDDTITVTILDNNGKKNLLTYMSICIWSTNY